MRRSRVAVVVLMLRSRMRHGGGIAVVTFLGFGSRVRRCRVAVVVLMRGRAGVGMFWVAFVLGRTTRRTGMRSWSRIAAVFLLTTRAGVRARMRTRMRDRQRVVVIIIIIIIGVARAWEREGRLNMWRLRWLEGIGWSWMVALWVTFWMTLGMALWVVALWIGFGNLLESNRWCIGVSTMGLGRGMTAILSFRAWGFSLRSFGV